MPAKNDKLATTSLSSPIGPVDGTPGSGLTDKQRDQLVAKALDDPYFSHVKAARAFGVQCSAGQIRQTLAADDAFQEALAEARGQMLETAGLGVKHLLSKLAHIVNDDGNSSQLRATERAFSFHGIHFNERQQVDVNHTGEVRNPDVAEAVERLNALVAAAALRSAPADRPQLDPPKP